MHRYAGAGCINVNNMLYIYYIDPNSYLQTLSHLTSSTPPPLHAVSVKEPPFIHSKMLALNCLVLGEIQQHIFPVKIDAAENVGTLKKLIKEKKKPVLDYTPADALYYIMLLRFRGIRNRSNFRYRSACLRFPLLRQRGLPWSLSKYL